MDQAEQLRNVIKLHNQNNQNNARAVSYTHLTLPTTPYV